MSEKHFIATDSLIGGVLSTSDDRLMRQPKSIRWVPQADITAHELALALSALLQCVSSRGWAIIYVEDMIAALPANVQRHFEVGP